MVGHTLLMLQTMPASLDASETFTVYYDIITPPLSFQISFVAIRGSTASRSIAIDDVSLLDDECTLQPLQSHSFTGEKFSITFIRSLHFRTTLTHFATNLGSSI